jgi:hypothetical protein
MIFTPTAQINPELYAKPVWYTGAFACLGFPVTEEHFFEPAQVLGDLEQITLKMLMRDVDLPPFYWLRVGVTTVFGSLLLGVEWTSITTESRAAFLPVGMVCRSMDAVVCCRALRM